MRALLLITILLGLSSCFKTDADGNAYLFENDNRAVISFEFFNADTTLTWYFGIQNQVGTNVTDVEGYNSSQIANPSTNNCKFCEFSENGVCEYSAKKLTSPSKENEWVSL